MEGSLVLFYIGKKENLPSLLSFNGIYYTTDEKHLYIQDTEFLDKDSILNLRKTISKSDYKSYLKGTIDENSDDFNRVLFLDDGSALIYQGLLFINSPFWMKVVDEEPDEKEENTLYFIKE